MAEFRKNEENAKTVYLAAESKLTYYRSSGQWEEFKKEVMSQGKEAPFTDSKRKGKIYGITLDKEHDGASASNNASGKSTRKSERTADHLCKHPGTLLLSAGKSVHK